MRIENLWRLAEINLGPLYGHVADLQDAGYISADLQVLVSSSFVPILGRNYRSNMEYG